VDRIWTKNGRPLACRGNDVFTLAGALVGRISGDRVIRAVDTVYVGTLVGDRLVFRSFDSDGPDRPYARPVTDVAPDSVPPSQTWGDEPVLPD